VDVERRPLAQSGTSFVLQQLGRQVPVGGVPLRLMLVLQHLQTPYTDHRDIFHRIPLAKNAVGNMP
jgi:hypothetical protein